jgi:outer membrane protein, heavy metal efflux system
MNGYRLIACSITSMMVLLLVSTVQASWGVEQVPIVVTPAPDLPANAGVEDYISLAEKRNPGLQSAFHRWQGALQKVPQATSLEDPKLSYMEYLQRTMETQQELGVMQMFPYPGKLALRGQVESSEAEALRKELEKARLDLRAEVEDSFYEYYYLEQTIRINTENLDLLKHFENVATARYGVGRGGNQDVIKAQVELGKLENELRNLQDSRSPVCARLNATMNRPTSASLPPPSQVDTREVTLETEAILQAAFRGNPELQAIDARIRKANEQVALARKEYYPDFSLGLNWMNANNQMEDPMGDEYVASIEMNLPVYRKKVAAMVQEAQSGVQEFQSMKQETQNRLAVDLQDQLYKLRNAERQLKLLADLLIPKARQSLQITETSYSAGQASFLELVDTERELLMFQENYYRSIADYMQALAKIEALVGHSVVDQNAPPLLLPRIEQGPSSAEGPIETDSPNDTGTPEEPPQPGQ